MVLHFSHAHFPVTSLGYGRRVGLWLQGCSLGCPGCVAPQTWRRTAAHQVELGVLIARLRRFLRAADGVTISGGEPFEQPRALSALIAAVRRECPGGDLLVYSGRPAAWLQARHAAILACIDVLIPEPFVGEVRSTHPLAGSGNQPVMLLTELAHERYGTPALGSRSRINLAPADDRLRLAGIPRRGEMDRLAVVAAGAGGPSHPR
jgi:anaerobic ribonucleoside-triphosphate reductase activating protein